MRTDFYNLDFPDTNGEAGDAVSVEEYTDKTIQVSGTFTGLNMHIEGTLDGSNWDAITGSINTTDIVTLAPTVKQIRVRRTTLTSGTPIIKFSGRLYRS